MTRPDPRSFLRASLLAAVAVASTARGASADLTSLGGFNLITSGSITADQSDVQGRVLVGGTLGVNNFTFGTHLASIGVTSGVNGVFNVLGTGVTNPNNDNIATAYYATNSTGGTVTNPSITAQNASTVSGYTHNLSSVLTNLSASYGGLSNPASSTTISGGTVTFNASPTTIGGSSVAVFSVNQSYFALQNENFVLSSFNAGTTYIINVTGSGPLTFGGGLGLTSFVNLHESANILFNFEGATQLNGTPNLGASILAPDAILSTGNTLTGGVYALGVSGAGEIDLAESGSNNFKAGFEGYQPSVVPEPASVAMILIGGGMAAGFAAMRRRRGRAGSVA